MNITPAEVQERVNQRNAELVDSLNPKSTKKVEQARAALQAAEQDASSKLDAYSRSLILLEQLGGVREQLGHLAALEIEATNTRTLAAAALREWVSYSVTGDAYSLARFSNGASDAAKLSAIAPAIPDLRTELESQAADLVSRIKKLAAAGGVELATLLRQVKVETAKNPESKLARHLEAGRLEL